MLKQIFSLYRTDIVCLLTAVGLTACTLTPPDQQMSEARQALQSAAALINTHSDEGLKKAYLEAETALLQAESAMKNKDYRQAKQHIKESKLLSQGLLKQHRQRGDNAK